MAFVAVIHVNGKEKQIGVSRYAINQYGDSYEFSVAVADEWQNKGLGTLLMKYLIDYAREQGVERLY
jgi:acetyltransferase